MASILRCSAALSSSLSVKFLAMAGKATEVSSSTAASLRFPFPPPTTSTPAKTRVFRGSRSMQSAFATRFSTAWGCARTGNNSRTYFRAVHYQSGHRFREYQGWDGGGPTPSKFSVLVRPLLFTGAVVVGGLGLAAIYRDEQLKKQGWVWPSQRRQVAAIDVMGWRATVPQLVVGSLILVNGVVFACWTRSLRGAQSLENAYPWLRRYFLHHAFSGRALPLIGSAFSHATFPHFLFNMMALWSFGPSLCRDLGAENFLAYYFSAAALTSLGGMMVKLATTCTTPSLGASGAVLWMAATTAFRFPDAQFGIIFLPFITLPASTMILGIASLDCLGLLMGWKMFDHGAHLAAVLCGYVFVHGGGYAYGVNLQKQILVQWRQLRKSVK